MKLKAREVSAEDGEPQRHRPRLHKCFPSAPPAKKLKTHIHMHEHRPNTIRTEEITRSGSRWVSVSISASFSATATTSIRTTLSKRSVHQTAVSLLLFI